MQREVGRGRDQCVTCYIHFHARCEQSAECSIQRSRIQGVLPAVGASGHTYTVHIKVHARFLGQALHALLR
jgi:hypothetical protein